MSGGSWFHHSVSTVSRGNGGSAVGKASYITGEKFRESEAVMQLRHERISKREARLEQLPDDIDAARDTFEDLQRDDSATDKQKIKAAEKLHRLEKEQKNEAKGLRLDQKMLLQKDVGAHDYRRREGRLGAILHFPEGFEAGDALRDRETLYNAVELKDNRKNSVMLREAVVALPAELDAPDRHRLAHSYGQWLADTHNTFVDVALHAPDKRGNGKNHHAHIVFGVRELTGEQEPSKAFGDKLRYFDESYTGGSKAVTDMRHQWASMVNDALEATGSAERVDARTLEAQGLDREPTKHIGKNAWALQQRKGIDTDKARENRAIDSVNTGTEIWASFSPQALEALGNEQVQRARLEEASGYGDKAHDLYRHAKDTIKEQVHDWRGRVAHERDDEASELSH